jgi:hypothetical protein
MGAIEELRNDIAKLKEAIEVAETKKEEKKFKLPWGKKVGKGQAKKNYVTVIRIQENHQMDFKKLQIEDQTIMEDSIPRLATAGYVLYWKKNPFIILPSWSVEPFSTVKSTQESLEQGKNVNGYKILLAKMKMSAVTDKKQMSGALKWIIIAGLAAIVGYAFITGGGK